MTLAARAALLLAAVLAALAVAWRIHIKADLAGYARAQSEHAVAALESAAKAAATTAQLQKDKDHAIAQAATRAQRHRADADSARTELDRLRDAIATSPTHTGANTCPAATDRTDPARELLGQCAAALTDLAQTADRLHADRMTLWDAWPRPAHPPAQSPQ
jgi:hypothetical protein